MFNGRAPNCPGLALSAQARAALRLPPPQREGACITNATRGNARENTTALDTPYWFSCLGYQALYCTVMFPLYLALFL